MKAILPIGGTGRKLLPLTAVTLKPLLPVGSKTALDLIMEEVISSGYDEIAFVLKHRYQDVIDYVKINECYQNVSIEYIIQEDWGVGNAVLCAKDFINDERFAVILGDDILRADVPGLKQMNNICNHDYVVGCVNVPDKETINYGMLFSNDYSKKPIHASHVIEKPESYLGSNTAITGRYILQPEIFDILIEHLKSTPKMSLTDAVVVAAEGGDVFGVMLDGKRYDIGSMEGYHNAFLKAVDEDW